MSVVYKKNASVIHKVKNFEQARTSRCLMTRGIFCGTFDISSQTKKITVRKLLCKNEESFI